MNAMNSTGLILIGLARGPLVEGPVLISVAL
jgi:hypothetical protein